MEIVVYALLLILVASNWYWIGQCNKLLDKLMSRNYTEYAQNKNLERPKSRPAPSEEVHPLDVSYEEEAANKMNTMMGIG